MRDWGMRRPLIERTHTSGLGKLLDGFCQDEIAKIGEAEHEELVRPNERTIQRGRALLEPRLD